jgi:hypothetical protein
VSDFGRFRSNRREIHRTLLSVGDHYTSSGLVAGSLTGTSGFISRTVSMGLDTGSRRWDSTVGIGTGYGLHDQGVGVRVPVVSRILFSTLARLALGSTQPPIQWTQRSFSSQRQENLDIYIHRPYAFMA